MTNATLRSLEALVSSSLPAHAQILDHRQSHNDIVLRLAIPATVPYSEIETLRTNWESGSGWNIAIDTLYHSPELSREDIDSILNISPRKEAIKKILLEKDRLIIYTTDMKSMFGKDNRTYQRIQQAFPDYQISIRSAGPAEGSPNLMQLTEGIRRLKDYHGLGESVTAQIPPKFNVRKIKFSPARDYMTIIYGSNLVDDNEVQEMKEQLQGVTAWEVEFKQKIDNTGIVEKIIQAIPADFPPTKVIYRQDKKDIVIRCLGDASDKEKLHRFADELQPQIPVKITTWLNMPYGSRRAIILDLLPAEWGFWSVDYDDKHKTANIVCTDSPRKGTESILKRISDKLDMVVTLAENPFEKVIDPGLDAKLRELIPGTSGYICTKLHVASGQYKILVEKNSKGVKRGPLKDVLGSKPHIAVEPHLNRIRSSVKSLKRVTLSSILPPGMVLQQGYAYLTGYGACQEVGRSCFHLSLSGLNLLLDCGAGFGADPYPHVPGEIVKNLDGILLSHAHTDHSAFLPGLYARGCTAPVYATTPTLAIARILMRDFIKVQTQYRNQTVPFTSDNIVDVMRNSFAVEFNRPYNLAERTKVTFLNAGHILGSSMILIEDHGQRILYSGDVNINGSRVLQGADIPENLDHVVLETTYGGKIHETRELSEGMFLKSIESTLDKGGTVLIPSFAVGRAQEILAILADHPKIGKGKRYQIYIDGMIKVINDIHQYFMKGDEDVYLKNEILKNPEMFSGDNSFFQVVYSDRTREIISRDRGAKIILTTSGMCEGLAARYLTQLVEDPKNLLMLVGYQAQGTLGSYLLDKTEQVNLDGRIYDINIKRQSVNLSAHADQTQLLSVLGQNRVNTLVTMHGEPGPMRKFMGEAIKLANPKNSIKAKIGQTITLY